MRVLSVTACLLVIVLASAGGCGKARRNIASVVDAKTQDTYRVYREGTLPEALHSVRAYTEFLSNHREQIQSVRKVDLMLYTSHGHLAYMLMFSSNTTGASEEFELAYRSYLRHVRGQASHTSLSLSEFVRFIVEGIEAKDKSTAVAWKAGGTLSTDIVDRVQATLAEHGHLVKPP